jgi:hypothetical protein
MDISVNSINNTSMLQQVISTKMLKKSLNYQQDVMERLLSTLQDVGIGRNIDIKV